MYPTKINIDTDGPWGRIGAAGVVMEQSDERRNVLIDALESDVRMDGRVVAMFSADGELDPVGRLPYPRRLGDGEINQAGDIVQVHGTDYDPRQLSSECLERLHQLSMKHARRGLNLAQTGDMNALLSACRKHPETGTEKRRRVRDHMTGAGIENPDEIGVAFAAELEF